MVAARELGGELRAFLEEAGAEPVKVGAADLEMVAGLSRVNFTLVELTEYLLEKQVGEAFADLLFLIASSQSNRCPLVEGFRRPSLRSGLLNPSTKGQFPKLNHLSPFELAPVSFCSRPDILYQKCWLTTRSSMSVNASAWIRRMYMGIRSGVGQKRVQRKDPFQGLP